MAIDFSEDSQWVRSNCAAGELCFFEAETGLYIPAASRLRDVTWASQTCTMEYSVQGVWQPYRDGTEYTCCDANLFRGEDGVIVAIGKPTHMPISFYWMHSSSNPNSRCAGDNFGRIRLYRYPCINSLAYFKEYFASSATLRRLSFASGDSSLLCVSGADKLILQYRHDRHHEEDVAYQTFERRGLLEEGEEDVSEWLALFGGQGGEGTREAVLGELSKLITLRPWVGAIVEPSNARDFEVAQTLKHRLNLLHIYGYQSKLTRQAVSYNCNYDVLYATSRYVAVFNKKQNKQIFYQQHQHQVCAMAVSKDGKLVASVEKTLRPQIHIWDSSSAQQINCFDTHIVHRKGVLSLQFSDNKQHLVSLGADEDHTIALWTSVSGNWVQDAVLSAWSKGDIHPVLFVTFYSFDLPATPSYSSSNSMYHSILFASGGRFHVKFWSFTGTSIEPYYGEYSKQIKINTLLCGSRVGRQLVTGSTSGHLYVWKGRKLDRYIRAHEKGITSIAYFQNNIVATASKDGIVKIWTADFQHMKNLSLADADIPPIVNSINSIDGIVSEKHLLQLMVSTTSGEVYDMYVTSGRINLLLEGHYDGELRGLAVNPVNPDEFVTVGDDKTIRIWSIKHRRLVKKALIDCTARAVDYSSNGKLLIVGLGGRADGSRQRKDGAFLLLDAATLKPKYEGRDSRHWLTDVKFSPDGKSFALCSMDHKIYIYYSDSFKLKGTCSRHNAAVVHVDFSVDGHYLQSDSTDYEHLFFEAEDGEYFSVPSQLRDILWSDWTCIYGWPVQGIWPVLDEQGQSTGAEPSACHRSPNQKLLAVGDHGGKVKLLSYPCLSKRATSLQADGHVGSVSRVKFTADGRYVCFSTCSSLPYIPLYLLSYDFWFRRYLISTGEEDRSIILWEVVPTK
ncbi:hypothetical protein EON64_08310 [archaeon]|nr:MAG: hypothetical protein EON64_08310 [archaeon]